MIITRTPFRISFFGGGTDYPVYADKYGGAVLSTSIDKYTYITCRYLPPFFDHKYRISYSKLEYIKQLDEINHPSVRECLRFMHISEGVEIHNDADLPARSGLGSSSSFTVGLLNALNALKGKMTDALTLARNAIYVEQKMIGENVGYQDQVIAAYGGMNVIEFGFDGSIGVRAITISTSRLLDLNRRLLLFFTGLVRNASEIAVDQITNTPFKTTELTEMKKMVGEAVSLLNSDRPLSEFGKLLHESWQLKRTLSNKISNQFVDDAYAAARTAGAVGGKILGAGGGGFLLCYAEPEYHSNISKALSRLLQIPFRFDNYGSRVIYYQPDDAIR